MTATLHHSNNFGNTVRFLKTQLSSLEMRKHQLERQVGKASTSKSSIEEDSNSVDEMEEAQTSEEEEEVDDSPSTNYNVDDANASIELRIKEFCILTMS